MKKIKITVSILLFSCIAITNLHCSKPDGASPEPPPDPPKPGAVQGKVFNEFNQPLNGAKLSLQGNGINTSVETNAGDYFFKSVLPGTYNLLVKKDGYIEMAASIVIQQSDTLTKNFTLKAGTAYLNLLSDTVIIAKPFANTYKIKVASNTTWTFNNTNNWITPAKLSGSGDDSVSLTIPAFDKDTAREGVVMVQAGSITKKILVKQLPEVKLKQSIPIPGNGALGIKDSISLLFNQPVTVTAIVPGLQTCQSEIKFSYSGNKITFSYACARLGGDYPFTITTLNSFGDQYTFAFSVGFYENIINMSGSIRSYFVNDADNSYWVMTDHPNALYKIDMSSLKILQRYDLPYEPVMFTVSPYNNKIYIAYDRIPKLFIMDQSGITEKVVDIVHDTTRTQYESGPRIYPMKLAFTKSGKGMIRLGDGSSNAYTGFWYIDAADNHRIWYTPLPGDVVNYEDVNVNHDKTRLILTGMGYNADVITFDPIAMQYSSYKPSKVTGSKFNFPSRKNDYVLSGQLYNHLIVNPKTGFESQESIRGSSFVGTVEFYNRPGKDLVMYYIEDGQLEVVDFVARKAPVKYDALYYARFPTATFDGKHLILSWHDGNYNAKVIQLPGSWFDF